MKHKEYSARNQTTAAAAVPGPYGLYLGNHVGAIWLVWVKYLFWLLPYMAHLMAGTREICEGKGFPHLSMLGG